VKVDLLKPVWYTAIVNGMIGGSANVEQHFEGSVGCDEAHITYAHSLRSIKREIRGWLRDIQWAAIACEDKISDIDMSVTSRQRWTRDCPDGH
jgi:hypothetical protein